MTISRILNCWHSRRDRARTWLIVKIVSVYKGDRFSDTCMSLLMPDFEDAEQMLQEKTGR